MQYVEWQYADHSVRPCGDAELRTAAASVRSSLTGAVSRARGCLMVAFSLANAGPMDGDEVVIMFAERQPAGGADADPDGPPLKQVVAFRRVSVPVRAFGRVGRGLG